MTTRKVVTFVAPNVPGAISVPGVKAGDVMLFAATADGNDTTSLFAKFILVDNEIVLVNAALANTHTAVLSREAVA